MIPAPDPHAARLAEITAAPDAPESYDPAIWSTLSDLLPCHPDHGCTDECECTAGEVRMAAERLIMAERIHQADCEGDGCCDRISRAALSVRFDTTRAREAVADELGRHGDYVLTPAFEDGDLFLACSCGVNLGDAAAADGAGFGHRRVTHRAHVADAVLAAITGGGR